MALNLPSPSPDLVTALVFAASEPGVGMRVLDRHLRAEETTHGELLAAARIVAANLKKAGLGPGDHVALMLPTSLDFPRIFYGCLLAGVVPAPLYPPVRLGRLDAFLESSAAVMRRLPARALIVDRRVARVVGRLVSETRPRSGAVGGLMLADVLCAGAALAPRPDGDRIPDPDDVAFIQCSSGTTRSPTPIPQTHRAVTANIEAIIAALPESVRQAPGGCVSWLPLYHDMGLIGCLLSAVRAARPLTLIPPELFMVRPVIWLEALSRYRGAISAAPDFAYGLCLDKIKPADTAGLDLSDWQVALDGAEPISADTLRAFAARFASNGLRPEALTPVYGLAEAALAVTFSPVDVPFTARRFDRDALATGVARDVPKGAPKGAPNGVELVSVGRPLPGYQIEVRNSAGERVRDTVVGRVWARGPSLVKAYHNAPAPVRDGWLDTGDVGVVCDDELYLCGRAKDVIIVRGKNHAPQDLERVCSEVAGVRTGCVIAGADGVGGREQAVLLVEVRQERDGLAEDCKRAVRAACGLEPGLVVLLAPGTLPRTSSGKLRRAEALAQWRAGTLTPPRSMGPAAMAGLFVSSAVLRLRAPRATYGGGGVGGVVGVDGPAARRQVATPSTRTARAGRTADLIVVGGGPAGLGAAIAAAQRGARVVVLEPRVGPIDKACGEGLMPAALAGLAGLGIDAESLPSWPLRGVCYRDGEDPTLVARGAFTSGVGRGMRRLVLHMALAERARELGVVVVPHKVREVRSTEESVAADGWSAPYLIGADGLHSRVRREIGLPAATPGERYGARQHFALAPWCDEVEVYWRDGVEAYVTPVAADCVGVALLFALSARSPARATTGGSAEGQQGVFDGLLAQFPALAARLDGASPTSPVRGAGPLWQVVPSARCGRVLLVGDAAGYVDALTGDGVALGLATAAAAVDAILADRPQRYDAAHERLTRAYRYGTRALLMATRLQWTRRLVLRGLAAAPWVFDYALDQLGGDPRSRPRRR
jgi:acyl-CoA synthetase (AMP-forming)/AMP-acid ligase II/flavin-dependent dehydrogenase